MSARAVVNPRLELQAVLDAERELMNAYAPSYRSFNLFNSYIYEEKRRRFVRWSLETLRRGGADPARLSILEAGTSTGDTLQLFAEAGCRRLTGLDIAERMLEQARRQVPAAEFVHGAIERQEFGGRRFDVILSTFTLHHMHDPRAFFALVDRYLAPEGWFFVAEYNATAWTDAGWTKPAINLAAAPIRRALKWKNRARLAGPESLPYRFNPAHRLLSYEDIVASMPHREAYALRRWTEGLFLPAFIHALVRESALDRWVFRTLDRMDRLAEPFDKGEMQWIAGRRTGRIPG
jgi:ubiquinone/menaquinone biosynthesis C-methylase UbiE